LKEHDYLIHGLSFKSFMACPALVNKAEENPDVIIREGKVPVQLNHTLDSGVRFEANEDQFLLKVDGIASYLVTNGKEIIVEKDANASDKEVCLFLFGSVMGALLLQRDYFPFHGSAIEHENGAIIFSGPSGSGKSTLAASFVTEGYKFVADDISAVKMDFSGRSPILFPGLPQLKLWYDALEKLQLQIYPRTKVRPQLEKYFYFNKKNFRVDPLPLKQVYILESHNKKDFQLIELQGIEKFNGVKNNLYRGGFAKGLNKMKYQFKTNSLIGKNIRVCKLKRPAKDFDPIKFVDFVKEDFGKIKPGK
jgi:hypothetical protein